MPALASRPAGLHTIEAAAPRANSAEVDEARSGAQPQQLAQHTSEAAAAAVQAEVQAAAARSMRAAMARAAVARETRARKVGSAAAAVEGAGRQRQGQAMTAGSAGHCGQASESMMGEGLRGPELLGALELEE